MSREELLYAAAEHRRGRRMTDIAKELYVDRSGLYKQLKASGIDYKNKHVYKARNKVLDSNCKYIRRDVESVGPDDEAI